MQEADEHRREMEALRERLTRLSEAALPGRLQTRFRLWP